MTDNFSKVRVTCPPCIYCGKSEAMSLDVEPFSRYQRGLPVQQAFPEMSPAERETLRTGIHGRCWNEMFGSDSEDEPEHSQV